jgi:hypothetical protein
MPRPVYRQPGLLVAQPCGDLSRPQVVLPSQQRDLSLRAEQPGPLAASGVPAQCRPCPRCRLEGVLDQVRGQLPVAVSTHARVPKQPPVMICEETA